MTRRVAVFARPPVPGRVKSRLAPGLTAPLACDLYRAMLVDALAAAREAQADHRYIYWAEPLEQQMPFDLAGFEPRLQRGVELGERLAAAFAELLRTPGDLAVAIGADCPELDGGAISRAFDLLGGADAAFGPTTDGGYYLVAMRRSEPALFRDIEWGTERALAQTLDRARAAELTVARLDPLDDIDEPGDVVRFIARAADRSPERSRETLAALRRMGLLPGGPPTGG